MELITAEKAEIFPQNGMVILGEQEYKVYSFQSCHSLPSFETCSCTWMMIELRVSFRRITSMEKVTERSSPNT